MLITTVETNKDYTNALPVDILLDVDLPTILFTNQSVVSTNELVFFDVPLADFDFSVDLIFDDGTGTIQTLLGQFGSATLTAAYTNEGIYSISLSSRQYVNPNIVSITNYTNYIAVKDGNEIYDNDSDRQIFSQLELPFDRDEMCIKPSEFVTDSTFNTIVDKFFTNLEYLVDQTILYSQSLPVLWKEYWNGSTWNIGVPETSGMSDILDLVQHNDKIITIENNKIVFREDDYYLSKINETANITEAEVFNKPVSLSIYNDKLAVVDEGKNSFYIFTIEEETLTLDLYLGGFGTFSDNYRFNIPSDIFLDNNGLLIVDSGNNCIKQYTTSYHWSNTYKQIEANILKVVRNNNYIFVLADDGKVYRLNDGDTINSTILNPQITNPKTIILDDYNTELLYVFGESQVSILDFSGKIIASSGNFPKLNNVFQLDKKYIGVGDDFIGRFIDYLTLTQLGSSEVSSQFWSKESVYMHWQEFDQQLMYNDSFSKMVDNLVLFTNYVSSVPVNYYDFDGNFIYQTYESVDFTSCNFEKSFIGINEIESFDVLKRQWNYIWDLMDCVRASISTKLKHPALDENNCLRWNSGKSSFDANTGTSNWPISWEELECDESSIPGTIRGILPQHWTWAWLMCERKNAPTFKELECEAEPNTAINTWEEMECSDDYAIQYTWETTGSLSALSTQYNELTCSTIWAGLRWIDLCGPDVENPYESWKNLDCCDSMYNSIPYDFDTFSIPDSPFTWTNLACEPTPPVPFSPLNIDGLVVWFDPTDDLYMEEITA